jgi:NTE family protein
VSGKDKLKKGTKTRRKAVNEEIIRICAIVAFKCDRVLRLYKYMVFYKIKCPRIITVFILLMFITVLANGQSEKNVERPSVALVLSGGGAMGVAHLPVLEAIEELNIPIDMIIGVSMGAIIGGLYCSGLTIDEIKTMLLTESWEPIFQDRPQNTLQNILDKSDFPLKLTLNRQLQPSMPSGYSSGVYVYELLKSYTLKIPSYYDFDELPIPFRSGAVNALSGELEIFKEGDIAEAIRASMSIPGVFQPIPIDGKYYIDGGVKDNFPLDVAKELGFDIIIGVDILDEIPESTKEEPHTNILNLRGQSRFLDRNTVLISQMARTNFLSADEPLWDAADLVIAPDVGDYTMLDFLKIEDIYKSSEKDKQQYIDALLPIKEKIEAATKNATPDINHNNNKTSYYDLPHIIIKDINFNGILPFDSTYINNAYNKLIKNKELTRKNFDKFIHTIYNTGNYDYVIARVDTRDDANTLIVLLANNTSDAMNTQISAALTYEGTASSDSVSELSVTGRVDFNGLSGPNSQLSIAISVLSNISGRVSYLHPLTPDMFLLGDITLLRKQTTTKQGLAYLALPEKEKENSRATLSDCGGGVLFGFKFDESNMLTLGPGFEYMNYSASLENSDDLVVSSYANAFPFRFDYRLSTLDSAIYATKGFYFNAINTFVFPVSKAAPVYNMITIDTSAAFPTNKFFSIIANVLVGADVIGNLTHKENLDQKPFFGFTTDRMYFPQITNNIDYYSNKAAASLIMQLRPWKSITILGGEVIMSVGISLGRLDDKFSNFIEDLMKFDAYYWNTSVNFGLKITDKSGISLRAGMGKTLSEELSPFVAFDIGVFRY